MKAARDATEVMVWLGEPPGINNYEPFHTYYSIVSGILGHTKMSYSVFCRI